LERARTLAHLEYNIAWIEIEHSLLLLGHFWPLKAMKGLEST